jgi:Ran-binding protein 1
MSDFAAAETAKAAEPETVGSTEKAEGGAAEGGAEGGEDDEGPAPEEESTATFTPVVSLKEVETETGEDEEDAIYTQRSKLFVYTEAMLDKGTGNKSWCERGVGDAKILKHRESNRIRILMRQEKTLKILVNHFVDPRITLTPNSGNDRSWVWVAFDFSNGESLEETTFAIRFKDSDIAAAFKTAFEDAQSKNRSILDGADAAEGAAEADAAADALAAVSVGDKASPEKA